MKLIMINGNTSSDVTDALVAEARRYASPGTELAPVTMTEGPKIIRDRPGNTVAAGNIVTYLTEMTDTVDGAIIGVSLDTALDAARAVAPFPVVGMTEAALLSAFQIGRRVGLVIFDRQTLQLYQEQIAYYGYGERVAGIRPITVTAQRVWEDPDGARGETLETLNALAHEDGADTAIILGAVAMPLVDLVANESPLPIVNSPAASILQLESLIRLRRGPAA